MALQSQIDVVKSFAFHLFARYRASHTLAKIFAEHAQFIVR